MAEQKASIGLAKAGRPPKEIGGNSPPISPPNAPTYAAAGIDKRTTGAPPAERFSPIPDADKPKRNQPQAKSQKVAIVPPIEKSKARESAATQLRGAAASAGRPFHLVVAFAYGRDLSPSRPLQLDAEVLPQRAGHL
jgi:hypothetical protein